MRAYRRLFLLFAIALVFCCASSTQAQSFTLEQVTSSPFPSELTISVTTRPQPPWRFTSLRKAVSVMPAMGAMTNGDASETGPILTLFSIPSTASRPPRPLPR